MKWKGTYACPNCGGRDLEPLQGGRTGIPSSEEVLEFLEGEQ